MKNRIQKRLTSKGTILLSILMAILAISLIIYLIVAIFSNSFNFATFVILYALIFAVAPVLGVSIGSVNRAEAKLQAKNNAIRFLNKEEFVQISYTPDSNCSKEYEMLLTIIEKIECRFFAKLKEDDEIILMVKDKENNEIYSCEISNYYYFNARFKPKAHQSVKTQNKFVKEIYK